MNIVSERKERLREETRHTEKEQTDRHNFFSLNLEKTFFFKQQSSNIYHNSETLPCLDGR